MHDIAEFTPLLSHPRFTEKLLLAQRTLGDANARKTAADEAANGKINWRIGRRADLQDTLRRGRETARRNDDHKELEAQLAALDDSERQFRTEIGGARRRADEDYQLAAAPVFAAFAWLDEQRADWRAAGEPEGPWLRHVPAVLKGKNPSVELIREIRADLHEIDLQVLDTRRCPATAVELKASVDAALAEVAGRVPLTLDPYHRRSDPFGLISAMTHPSIQLGRGAVPGAAAVLFALLGPGLRQHFHEQIDAADLTGAMSAEQQDRELERLAEKRLGLERQEEAVVCALAADGLTIARRPDLDPRAFLEVEER